MGSAGVLSSKSAIFVHNKLSPISDFRLELVNAKNRLKFVSSVLIRTRSASDLEWTSNRDRYYIYSTVADSRIRRAT